LDPVGTDDMGLSTIEDDVDLETSNDLDITYYIEATSSLSGILPHPIPESEIKNFYLHFNRKNVSGMLN
jgi:hypothetical protein